MRAVQVAAKTVFAVGVVAVREGPGSEVGRDAGSGVGVEVGVSCGMAVGVGVMVDVGAGVGVSVGVNVGVATDVAVGVGVSVGGGVGVGPPQPNVKFASHVPQRPSFSAPVASTRAYSCATQKESFVGSIAVAE